jgi:uncharacterized membrane protein
MANRWTLAGGAGLGAGVMYLLDPDKGRRRRALTRDKVLHFANKAGEAIGTTSTDLSHRTAGTLARVRGRFGGKDVPDHVLTERVRARIGRAVSHPRSIEVSSEFGWVTLQGPVLLNELDELLRAVWSVPGVREVENRLEVHREPGDVPGLQGGSTRPGRRSELRQRNWSPSARFLTGAAAGALGVAGLRRGGVVGWTLAALGGAGVARALANRPVRQMAGLGGRRAVDFHKTINVQAPIEEVFDFWTNFENFPRFMSHVRQVRKTGDGRSHWVAAGPGGTEVEWDAVVTECDPNRVVAWRSEPGSTVGNAGIVRFDPNPDGGTRIDIRMSYNPPAGGLGHVVAALFGADPKRAMDEDLVRFKSLLEDGKTTTPRQGTVDLEQVQQKGNGQGSGPGV